MVYNVPGITSRRYYSYTEQRDVRVASLPLVLNSTALGISSRLPSFYIPLSFILFSWNKTAGIWTGKITMWNDPVLVDLNPGFSLPAQNISLIVRSDGSGTSQAFTAYLSEISPTFASKVGSSTTPLWNSKLYIYPPQYIS